MQAGMQITISCIDNGILVAIPPSKFLNTEGRMYFYPNLKEALDYIESNYSETDFKPE